MGKVVVTSGSDWKSGQVLAMGDGVDGSVITSPFRGRIWIFLEVSVKKVRCIFAWVSLDEYSKDIPSLCLLIPVIYYLLAFYGNLLFVVYSSSELLLKSFEKLSIWTYFYHGSMDSIYFHFEFFWKSTLVNIRKNF